MNILWCWTTAVDPIIFTTEIWLNTYDLLILQFSDTIAKFQCSWLVLAVTIWDDMQANLILGGKLYWLVYHTEGCAVLCVHVTDFFFMVLQ